MSNNKNKEKAPQEPVNSIGELDQLRKIVFGDAQQQLISQIATLRSDMNNALNEKTKRFHSI